MRIRLPDDLELRSAPQATTAVKRLRLCAVCQQEYDPRSLDEVYHHGPEPHEPYSGSRYALADEPSRRRG